MEKHAVEQRLIIKKGHYICIYKGNSFICNKKDLILHKLVVGGWNYIWFFKKKAYYLL